MKKAFLAGILALFVCVSGVFSAENNNPGGWGIGAGFHGGYGNESLNGAALSLKAPQLPIYWGAQLGFRSHYFSFGLTGDYYVLDRPLVRDINLGWYLGVGGFFDFGSYSAGGYGWNYLDLGARVPIGLSWQPLRWLEVFGEAAPGLGLGLFFGDFAGDAAELFWAFNVAIGVRFWF